MVQHIDEFKDFLTMHRGLADTTIRAYTYDLAYYAAWLDNAQKKLEDIGPKDLDGYVRHMRNDLKLGPKTCKRRIAAISTYHKWMVREGMLKNDPVYYIELPKAPARLPVYLNEEEIELFVKMMDEEADARPIIGVRNRALFYLMMFGGLRISEALTLKVSQVTIRDGYPVLVTVIGKGNKERQVPLNEAITRTLLAWIETKILLRDNDDIARKYTKKSRTELVSEYLFPGKGGKPINKYTVQAKFKALRDKYFKGKHMTPHKLRHTFATSLFRAKVDIKTIQELLGHSSIATTQIYTHVEDEQKRNAVMRIGKRT